MLHQDLSASAFHQGVFAMGQASDTGELIRLLAGARRALDERPEDSRAYLERIAALFQPKDAERDEAMLLPAMPPRPAEPAKGGLAGWQLKRVIEHVDAALDGPVMIEALAACARLSAGHFCRAFKASVGETPHAFVVRRRIRRAQTLMLRTDETLSQIACACGLTDQAHLTRLFRKIVGDTPRAWRRAWSVPA